MLSVSECLRESYEEGLIDLSDVWEIRYKDAEEAQRFYFSALLAAQPGTCAYRTFEQMYWHFRNLSLRAQRRWLRELQRSWFAV